MGLSPGRPGTHDREVFDSHCHLDLPVFDPDRDAVLARARAVGVQAILLPGIRPNTWAGLRELAATVLSPALYPAIGVHPQIVAHLDPAERVLATDPEALAEHARAAGAVAIGECGLDGQSEAPEDQEAVFRAHIRAAVELGLPLVIHVLRAHHLAPKVLAEEGAAAVGGVLHSYSGGPGLLSVYADLGFAFSFAGPLTYPGARRPTLAAAEVRPELLLVESDAPDQSPHSQRGQRNEPAFLPETLEALASVREQTPAQIALLTTENARRLFKLGPPA